MNEEMRIQQQYWDREASAFKAIYSHEKSPFLNLLDRIFRKDMYERFVFTIQHAAPYEGKTFLDVGCGNGVYAIELAKKGAAGVVGLDIASNMIDQARQSAEHEHLADRCSFVHTDLLQYSPGSRFDVAIGIGLFDYVRNPLPVLRRMREVTNDKIIVSFPRLWTWRAPLRKVRLTVRGCPVYFFTRTRIMKLLHEAGFQEHQIYRVGKLFCVVAT
ncbi:MAG: class I SAM-dependent methyltransferase [Bacteroidota bacterium]